MASYHVHTPDGWRLAVEHYPAAGWWRGAVVAGHAMMVNRRTLDRPRGQGLASTLAAAGFDVYAFDVRGHGESGPRAGQGASWTYEDIVRGDIPAVVRHAAGRHGGPVALLGHSLVAHAGLASLALDPGLPVRALVSLAGNVWLPQHEPSRARRAAKRAALAFFERLTRRHGYFPARKLGMGSDDEAAAYVASFPLWWHSGRWFSHDARVDYLDLLPRVRVRMLSVLGAGDTMYCDPASAGALFARCRDARVQTMIFGRASGLGFDPGHMALVTDGRSRPVWHAVAAWLASQGEGEGRPHARE